ncbi:hypothetical protein KY306_02370 [Candidatus Woesearchaeota archaeon]|nr:hypothetical protein [Candidatus Woesearchaeota archaeon]
MAKKKKKMSGQQEFEVMKLVLDKFLWLGFIVMGWGMYKSLTEAFLSGIWYMIAGAVLLIVFMIVIVKEYEIIA